MSETFQVKLVSMFTHKMNSLEFPAEAKQEILDWLEDGTAERPLIQRAFPSFTAEQREFLMTGSTQEEWDKLFGTDPDENLEDDAEGGHPAL